MNIGDKIGIKYKPEYNTILVTVTQIFDDGSFVATTSPGHKTRFSPEQVVSMDSLVRCSDGCGYWVKPGELCKSCQCWRTSGTK